MEHRATARRIRPLDDAIRTAIHHRTDQVPRFRGVDYTEVSLQKRDPPGLRSQLTARSCRVQSVGGAKEALHGQLAARSVPHASRILSQAPGHDDGARLL